MDQLVRKYARSGDGDSKSVGEAELRTKIASLEETLARVSFVVVEQERVLTKLQTTLEKLDFSSINISVNETNKNPKVTFDYNCVSSSLGDEEEEEAGEEAGDEEEEEAGDEEEEEDGEEEEEEEDGEEEEEAGEEEEGEERSCCDLYKVIVDGNEYLTNDKRNGCIYKLLVSYNPNVHRMGKILGYFKNGVPVLNK